MKYCLLLLSLVFISSGHTSGTSVGNGLVADSVEKSCKKADGSIVPMKKGESCEGELIDSKPATKPEEKPKTPPTGEDKPAPKK